MKSASGSFFFVVIVSVKSCRINLGLIWQNVKPPFPITPLRGGQLSIENFTFINGFTSSARAYVEMLQDSLRVTQPFLFVEKIN